MTCAALLEYMYQEGARGTVHLAKNFLDCKAGV